MKVFFSILIVIVVLGILAGVAKGIRVPVTGNPAISPSVTPVVGGLKPRLQECPDEMIVDKMPGPGGPKPSYYILKGERREISEFDDAWVAQNCNIASQTVY